MALGRREISGPTNHTVSGSELDLNRNKKSSYALMTTADDFSTLPWMALGRREISGPTSPTVSGSELNLNRNKTPMTTTDDLHSVIIIMKTYQMPHLEMSPK